MSILNLYKHIHIYVYIIYKIWWEYLISSFMLDSFLYLHTISHEQFFSPGNPSLFQMSSVKKKKSPESTVFQWHFWREASGQNRQCWMACDFLRYFSMGILIILSQTKGVSYQVLPHIQPQWKEFNSWLISQNHQHIFQYFKPETLLKLFYGCLVTLEVILYPLMSRVPHHILLILSMVLSNHRMVQQNQQASVNFGHMQLVWFCAWSRLILMK